MRGGGSDGSKSLKIMSVNELVIVNQSVTHSSFIQVDIAVRINLRLKTLFSNLSAAILSPI